MKDDARVLIAWQVTQGAPGTKQEVVAGVTRELWPPPSEGFDGALRQLSVQLDRVCAATEVQAEATTENTSALQENTAAQASWSESTAASVGRSLARVFTSGLGLSPLISGLVGLFRRDEHVETVSWTKYAAPPKLYFEGRISRSGSWPEEQGTTAGYGGSAEGWLSPGQVRGPAVQPVQVTVQVQAIDSRSFMDHSWEIARAVRDAMLHSHALNDVVVEL
ncbi:MAG: hypothetical protein ACPL88_03275 [Bryobacteraceae bacterium]